MTKRTSDAAGMKSEPKSYSEICAEGLRKGKWTVEEEKYASTIIAHFERNLLPISAQKESTIRLYLGKELHCDPMRISKKFVGINSVGKHFFCWKHEDGQHQTAEALDTAKTEREALRQAFVESVEKEVFAASKRPKRIRIRNRKKKPKVVEPDLFTWDFNKEDDLFDLQNLLDENVNKESESTVTPCRSPREHCQQQPVTPPSDPLPIVFEHDKFTLDGGTRVCAPNPPGHYVCAGGAFVEPPRALVMPATAGIPPPVPVNMAYPNHFVLVSVPPQPLSCPPMLPVQQPAPVFDQTANIADTCLEDILGCEDDEDEYNFIDIQV
jgi:hypothetical protein